MADAQTPIQAKPVQKSIFSFFNKKDTKSSGESCSDRDLDGISVLEKEKEHNSNETTKDCGIAFVTPKVGDNNPDAGKAIDACLTDSAPKKRRGRAKGKARQTKPKEKESVKITEGTPSELDVKKSLFGSDKDEPGSAESVKLSDSKEIREEVTASVVAMEVTDLTGAEDSEKSPSTATDMFASTPLKEAHVVLPSVGGGTLQTLWSKQKENRAVAKTLDSTDSGESAIHSANSVVPMEIDSAPICSEGFATNKNQNDSAEFVVTDVDEVNNLTSEEALSAGMSPTVGSDEATVANERVTLAPKKRNRKKSVKAASASALVEEGSEVTAPAAKKRRVTKKATASSTVITDVDSCVAEVVNPTKVSTPTGSLPATPVANKIEYSPEILAKIEINNEKIKHFLEELQATEKLVDLFDSNLDIDEAINALLEQCMSKELKINLTAGSTTESILEDTVVNSSGITDSADPESIGSSDRVPVDVVMAIRTVIARKVQGSSLPLSAIIPDIIELFISLKKKVVEGVGATAENDSVSPLQCIDKYCEPLKLSEDIKLLASRESYGLKGKNAPLFEDSDQLACWRWDTTSSIYFTKTGQGIIREVKTVRSRYSRAIKAVVKVVEQLKKMPYDEAKVAFTEEKLAKVVVEIEKAKEKRREMDGKRAADLEEKSKREAIKEEKKREKEETELMKKEMNESIAFERAMKKKKPSNTENEKKKALLEKQKNVFMNFLSSKKLVDTPPVPDKSVSEKIRNGLPPAHSSSTKEVEDFNRNIRVTMEMADIINSYRLRYKKRGFVNSTLKNSKTPRGKKKILVAVTQNEGSAFGGGEYTEMKEKWVDNRMRLFSFAEDYRPAYCGTFSKRSRFVTGRRPLAKDNSIMNYEYDSEAEWEEEDEGEDIMQSDDEEEDDGNEIEYDDFFCRDNDFGSDAESDGEDCTGAIALGTMEKEEILGPQYCSISLPTADAISITQLRDKDGLVYIVDSLNAVVAKTCSSAKCANNSVSWDDFNQSWVAEMEDCDNEPHTYEELIRYTAITFKSVVAPTLLNFSSRVERQKQREKERLEKEQKKAADNLASTSINESGSDGSARAGQSSKSKEYFSDEKLQDLVKFLHGRKEPFDKLVELFHSSHSSLPKLHIKRKIQEVSVKSRHAEGFGSARWVVKPEVFESVKMVQPEPLEYTPSKKIKRISREHTETDVSAGKFCSEKVKPRKKKAKLAGAIGLDITSASPTADATFAVAEKEVVIAAKEIQRSDLLAIKKTPITKQIKKIEPQKIIPEKKKQGSLAHAFAFACVKNTETTDTLVGDNENVGGKVIGELVSPVVEAVCSLDKSEVDSQDSNPFEMADEKTVTTNKDMNSDLQLFDPACSDHLDGSLEADIVNTPGSRKCVSFSELAESKHFSSNEAVLQTKIAPVISVPLSKAQVGLGAQFLQDIEKASC